MKRLRALLLLCVALLALDAQARHFLWQAEKNGQHVWLLGSVHLGRADFYPLAKPIEDAYRQSKTLVVEADVSDPTAAMPLMATAMLPSDQTLPDLLNEAQNQHLDKVLVQVGLAHLVADHMKPWLLAITLEAMELQHLGLAADAGIDLHFLGKAKADHKPIVELESIQAQFDLFDQMPQDDTLALLNATLDDADDAHAKAQMDAMVSAWKHGDGEAMRRVIAEDSPDTPAFKRINEKLFGERNRAMADKIAALASTTTPLVVVGAGHLVGPDSVIERLRARGFHITQY